MSYSKFITDKEQRQSDSGFKPTFNPDFLFDFQWHLTDWAIHKGRSAIFADCGTGKTPMSLVWSQNMVEHTNRPTLIITPLAVSAQTVKEGAKFGIEVVQSRNGNFDRSKKIIVTNYEKLHLFNNSDFSAVVCDESGILKNFSGVRKKAITEFMRTVPYRLLCTATAAPNDYIELGTSSEALGELGYMDMLNRFFKNDNNSCSGKSMYKNRALKWRFKHHAEIIFWKWISSWARAIRKPSDLGFDNKDFILPAKIERQHVVTATRPFPGKLFPEEAKNRIEELQEIRATLEERCEKVAELVNHDRPAIIWCQLNDEEDLLKKIVPDAVCVSGQDKSDEDREEKLMAFVDGKVKKLITKPKVAGFGLNMQHCSHMTFFPSHSFEMQYQAVRRCWRFGQKNEVVVDVVTTPGMERVLENLQRKADAADRMFSSLLEQINGAITINRNNQFTNRMEVPTWMKK